MGLNVKKADSMNNGEELKGYTKEEGVTVMDNDTKEMLWRVMDENSQLKQENMMLKSKLNQIKRLF